MKKLIVSIIILFPTSAFAQVTQRQTITFEGREVKPSIARAYAYAPNIISKCSGSLAGGAQGQFFGLSLAGSYKDEFCERAELIKLAISMGHRDVANDLFFEFPMVQALNKEQQIKKICDYPTKCTRLGR